MQISFINFQKKIYYKIINNKVLFLIIFAFCVRVLVAFCDNNQKVWLDYGDDIGRLNFAKSIIENGLVPPSSNYKSPESIFAPVIPIILSISLILFNDYWFPIFILNSLIGALTCLAIFHIAHRYFSLRIAYISCAWATIYPNFIRYIGTSGNEPWIVFLMSFVVLSAIYIIESKSLKKSIFFYSFLFAFLYHTDERYVAYFPFFTIVLFLGNSTVKVKLQKVSVFLLLSFIFAIPWLVRNYLYYKEVVVISVRTTALTKHFLKHNENILFFDHESNSQYLSAPQIDSVRLGLLDHFNDGRPISELQIKAMRDGNLPHKFNSIEKFWSRFIFLWMPFKFKDNYRISGFNFKASWSLKHNFLNIVTYAILLPFAFCSIIELFRKRKMIQFYLFSGLLIFHTFIHVVFIPYTRDRYRHPIDFIIIILGVYGIFIFINLFRKKKQSA